MIVKRGNLMVNCVQYRKWDHCSLTLRSLGTSAPFRQAGGLAIGDDAKLAKS